MYHFEKKNSKKIFPRGATWKCLGAPRERFPGSRRACTKTWVCKTGVLGRCQFATWRICLFVACIQRRRDTTPKQCLAPATYKTIASKILLDADSRQSTVPHVYQQLRPDADVPRPTLGTVRTSRPHGTLFLRVKTHSARPGTAFTIIVRSLNHKPNYGVKYCVLAFPLQHCGVQHWMQTGRVVVTLP